MKDTLTALVLVCLALPGCSDPREAQLRKTTIPTYDRTTGRLRELTYDRNRNGTIDTWTEMDGARPVAARIDLDEDGKLDRWEYYDSAGALEKVGFSRKDDGKPDAWAFAGADGRIERIDASSASDMNRIDRREYYDAAGLVRAEDDTNADGAPDKWETYQRGALRTAEFDEDYDGKPDRRLTYEAGTLVLIESNRDARGDFVKRVAVK